MVDTTAQSVVFSGNRLAVRATGAGSFRTTLSNGRLVTTVVGSVPAKQDLATWSLGVDEWLPGGAGDSSSTTTHKSWTFDGTALKPWSQIDDISDAVGIGTYTTTVGLPDTWGAKSGATLDLGTVKGTFRVSVNGSSVGAVDQMSGVVDVSKYLRSGSNVIQVTVATTLVNRLRTTRSSEFSTKTKQDVGLLGPVTLKPFVQLALK